MGRIGRLSFGGAVAQVALVHREVVDKHRWVSDARFFMRSTQEGGLAAGVVGALLAVWFTFLTCFAWIFLATPLAETPHDLPRLPGALAGVMAAVGGLIANLAAWSGLQVLFAERVTVRTSFDLPVLGSLDWRAAALALLAGLCLFGTRLGLARTLAVCAPAGGLLHCLQRYNVAVAGRVGEAEQ
ncbi:MAG: chromate transporter [Rhodospirillales bacterium]|nr:chromate transporter [Rhodospirillales bacterium]